MKREEPNNVEAEMSVLGCAFLSKEAIDRIMDEVSVDAFYDEKHKLIYKAMVALHNDNTPIDVSTICNELDKSKSLDKVGGVEYISEITDSVPNIANLSYYMKIVNDKAILRRLINTTTSIQTECYDESDSVMDIVEHAERNILGVYNDKLSTEIRKVQDILPGLQEYMEKLSESNGDITGVRTGFIDFDKKTNGLQPNQVIIIAGRPGCGKSAFALNIALNAAIHDHRSVAFFSLEMSAEEILKRAFGAVGKIEGDTIKSGRFKNQDWKRWNEAYSELNDAKIFIDDTSGISVSEVRRKCRKLKNSEAGLDLIIIDYLQLLTSSAKYSGQRVQEVSEISRDIKKLAMELKVPVIALAQLSRGVEQRKGEDAKPKLSDLRESGSIEQDADMVLFLHSDEYGKYDGNINRKVELLLAKHRAGQLGSVDLMFRMNFGAFDNFINKEENNEER